MSHYYVQITYLEILGEEEVEEDGNQSPDVGLQGHCGKAYRKISFQFRMCHQQRGQK